jgi:hypothetical protein
MRTKRQPTEAQKQKAAENRAKFKELCQRVAAMSEDQRAALAIQCGPRKITGEPFSAYNACLLLSQHNAPTICGGFAQWRAQGRKVISGPGSGLMVWVPIGRKKKEQDETEATESSAKPGFILGYVFDVSQTAEIGAQQ